MAVGIQMVNLHHIRTVTRHREVLVYVVTTLGVVFLGVLEGVLLGVTVAVGVALNRLAHTRITHDEKEGAHHVHVRGQLTFLAVPRLSRTLHLVPQGTHVVVELDGSFMDHAAYESLQDWQNAHTARGGTAELTGRRAGVRDTGPDRTGIEAAPADTATGTTVGAASGTTTEVQARTTADAQTGEPTTSTACRCHPWTPWRNHQCDHRRSTPAGRHPAEPTDQPTDRPAPGTTEPSTPAPHATPEPEPTPSPDPTQAQAPAPTPAQAPAPAPAPTQAPAPAPPQSPPTVNWPVVSARSSATPHPRAG